MKTRLGVSAAAVGVLALLVPSLALSSSGKAEEAAARAARTVAQMTADEKVVLTNGILPLPLFPGSPTPPADAVPAAGYVPGVARLNVPALRETDASLGVHRHRAGAPMCCTMAER
jgi:beta-glucosidase